MELKNKRINFLGDSITEGWGTTCPEAQYENRIAEKYGAVARIYGLGGTRIAKQKTPSENPLHDLDFITRMEEMDPDADVVVVFGGTNDYGHGDAPLGDMSSRDPYTFYGALHTLYTKLIEKYPAARIVVLTPLHREGEDNLRGDGFKAEEVAPLKTYVEIIREVAEYYSLPVLDLYRTSGIQPCVPILRKLYTMDGLHPNDLGHERMAEVIGAFLLAL